MTAETPGWTEVRVLVPVEWSELVADVLTEATSGSVAFGRPSLASDPVPEGFELVRAFYDERHDGPSYRAALVQNIERLGSTTGDERLGRAAATFKRLPPEDWANSWRKQWKPFRVGRLAVVTYDWSGQLRPSDVALRFEPGGAFGTGRHPTTRHCLRFLCEQELANKRVIDAGTGSGILCVAARLLGAASAFGFDIDERSALEGSNLAERNGIVENIEFAHGDFAHLEDREQSCDVLVANIYADVVELHAERLARTLVRGGRYALSGIHERHLEGLLVTLRASDLLDIDEVRSRGRWRTVLGTRR